MSCLMEQLARESKLMTTHCRQGVPSQSVGFLQQCCGSGMIYSGSGYGFLEIRILSHVIGNYLKNHLL